MIHDCILRAGERHQCPSCQRHQVLEEKARGLPASATALPAACQHLPALLAPSCIVQPLIQPNPAQISAHSSLLEAASHTTQGCRQEEGRSFLPRSGSLTWAELGEKLRTPTTLMPTTAKNNKATDKMIQKVLEGAGKCAVALLSWEPGQKKEEQELKLTILPILLHQTCFQLMKQILVQTGWCAELPNHCSTWSKGAFIPQRWNSTSSILVTSTATPREAAKPPGQSWSSSFPDTGNNKLNYFGLQQKSPAGPSALESDPVWSDPVSVPLPMLGCVGFSC